MNSTELILLKSDIITNMINGVSCVNEINEYFIKANIEDDEYVKLEMVFNLFYGIFKDSSLERIDEGYKEYICNTLGEVFSEELATLTSEFLITYFNVIEDKEILLEEKCEALSNIDIELLPNNNHMKKIYYSSLLNILLAKSPFEKDKISEVSAKLKLCL